MLRFFFWNLNNKNLGDQVARATAERGVDVVILSECHEPRDILRAMYREGLRNFLYHPSRIASKVEIFSQLPLKHIVPLTDSQGATFRKVIPLHGEDFLLVGVHLPSKLRMTQADQTLNCVSLATRIADEECILGHQRTLVVGDFNMNPFEQGIVAATGLHAVSDRAVAGKGSRRVKGIKYDFFYNPMWNHLGDAKGAKVAGTYFYDRSQFTEYFWHVFDQVLVRPPLAKGFDNNSVEIITKIGGASLLNRGGRPDATSYSDHLPITFYLDLRGETS